MEIKYYVDYQYLPKDSFRPQDEGEVVGIEVSSNSGLVILPNVGDYVNISETPQNERAFFNGKVKSRLFSYVRINNNLTHCNVNIVVEETNDNWGMLIKE